MTPQMQQAVLRVSTFYAPEPDAVFECVLEAVTSVYGDTMAMINLFDGERVRYRAVRNPHRLMRRAREARLEDTY